MRYQLFSLHLLGLYKHAHIRIIMREQLHSLVICLTHRPKIVSTFMELTLSVSQESVAHLSIIYTFLYMRCHLVSRPNAPCNLNWSGLLNHMCFVNRPCIVSELVDKYSGSEIECKSCSRVDPKLKRDVHSTALSGSGRCSVRISCAITFYPGNVCSDPGRVEGFLTTSTSPYHGGCLMGGKGAKTSPPGQQEGHTRPLPNHYHLTYCCRLQCVDKRPEAASIGSVGIVRADYIYQ